MYLVFGGANNCVIVLCHALSPAALLVFLGPGRLLAPAGELNFLPPSGPRPQSSCDKVSPLLGQDLTVFLKVFFLLVSGVFWLLMPMSWWKSTPTPALSPCPHSGAPMAYGLPYLHQVAVVLQHTAGGLPGVLVALPGVNPAGSPTKQQHHSWSLPGPPARATSSPLGWP